MDRFELRRLDYSLSEDHVADRNRARRRAFRLRQEPVGAVVRDGCDHDGAAGIVWR